MRKYLLAIAVLTLAFVAADAKTYVYVQNNMTSTRYVSVTRGGTSLSSSYWRQTRTSVPAGTRKYHLWFNRDSGIKNGKYFYFYTAATGGGHNFTLSQALNGDWIGSTMWQAACDQSSCTGWYKDRKWRDRYGYSNGRLKQLSFRAYFTGGDDDIEYVFTERPSSLYGQGSSNVFNVLAWNIYMRPTTLFFNGQSYRGTKIPGYIASYDAIVFSEAFDDDVRNDLINRLRSRFPYYTSVVGYDSGIKQDGGVFIMSRFPIETSGEKRFGSNCANSDCLSMKGVKYARINKYGRKYHLFGTHTQAFTSSADIKMRKKQFEIIRDYVTSKNIPSSQAVLIVGDLNVDRIKYPAEYQAMLSTLQAAQPARRGWAYSYDKNTNKLASDGREYLDYALYSTRHLRPRAANNEVMFLKTNRPWNDFFWEGDLWELSDHYPLYGIFEF